MYHNISRCPGQPFLEKFSEICGFRRDEKGGLVRFLLPPGAAYPGAEGDLLVDFYSFGRGFLADWEILRGKPIRPPAPKMDKRPGKVWGSV